MVQMILGIVGSPRKGKLTDQLVSKCLEGVKLAGVKSKKIYLIDYNIPVYTEQAKCPEELNMLCEEADALVIGAPVYWGGINGLTKDFMDTIRISNANGKHGLGISVAGGTGKGLCSAVQNIYRFYYHRRIRGIIPTPVSRFNLEKSMVSLIESGRTLAEISKRKKPFEGDKDRIEYYEPLDYLNYTFLDEILLLANQLMEISKDKPAFPFAKEEYQAAISLIKKGNRNKAIEHAAKAYNILYFEPSKE